MPSRSLPALACCLVALAWSGCGGAPFSGTPDVPDGYATYRGEGVSFVHPASWRPRTRSLGQGIAEIRFADPQGRGRSTAAVVLTVQPGVGDRFGTEVQGQRAVLEDVGGATVEQDEVDVEHARQAFRSLIEIPDRGAGPSTSQAVDVLARDGRHLALAAGGPDRNADRLDVDAVIGSLRLDP